MRFCSMTKLNKAIQAFVLFMTMFFLAVVSEADELSTELQSHFESEIPLKYVTYESIDKAHADEYGSMRYLVMDFELALANTDLQGSIRHICSVVLENENLVSRLSAEGYDMVSVSFDRQSQYDCL
jgi:UDP-N-acetylmuramate-alanine ligase